MGGREAVQRGGESARLGRRGVTQRGGRGADLHVFELIPKAQHEPLDVPDADLKPLQKPLEIQFLLRGYLPLRSL